MARQTSKRTVRHARALRREMTLPEALLWRALRKAEIKFRRQHPCGPPSPRPGKGARLNAPWTVSTASTSALALGLSPAAAAAPPPAPLLPGHAQWAGRRFEQPGTNRPHRA